MLFLLLLVLLLLLLLLKNLVIGREERKFGITCGNGHINHSAYLWVVKEQVI